MQEPHHEQQHPDGAAETAEAGLDRRQLLRTTAATSTALAAGALGGVTAGVTLTGGTTVVANTAATAATSGETCGRGIFPDYRYLRTVLKPSDLDYNPTGEIIFPCIIKAAGRVPNPRARYYLYYGPHDAPGGICLAYGNRLDGPFTEYENNPVIDNRFAHLEVTHVASPHALWMPEYREMFLYFHGENTVTRLARSKDGINFAYDKAVLSTRLQPAGTTEASYARVFRHDLPSRGARYVMVFMGNTTTNRRYIGWGWSPDARNWEFDQQPLIHPSEVGSRDIGAPCVIDHDGSTYIVYHQDQQAGGNMLVTEVGRDFSKRNHLGIFHESLDGPPDNGRCAAPSFATQGGMAYMFYEAGTRLRGSIAVARADLGRALGR